MMVDTNIVIDLREEDAHWFNWSTKALRDTLPNRPSVSAVVVGELASRAGSELEIAALLASFDLEAVSLNAQAGYRAGIAQRAYRAAGGGRDKLLADFLIGAHAATANLPLLTRDPRLYRTYFPELTLITPESHP